MVKDTPLHQPATTYRRNNIQPPPVEASPLITWGKIEDTTFLGLEKGGTDKKTFKVQATPSRDELGFKMASKIQGKKRELKQEEKKRDEHKLSMVTPETSRRSQGNSN